MSDQNNDSSPAPEDAFDFVRECIKTYRLAGDDVEHRIKALALLQKVTLPTAPVKEDSAGSNNRAAVEQAQDALRRK
jgi:hypothetical protein